MGVDGDGVDAGKPEVERGRPVEERDHQPPEGGVDVEEDAPVEGDLGEAGDGVDHPVLRRPGDADESDRVAIHKILDRTRIHPEPGVERHRPHLEPQDVAGLLEREVARRRDHHVRELHRVPVLCDPERLDVRLRPAGGRVPPRFGKVHQHAEPPDEEILKRGRPGEEPGVAEVGLEEQGMCPRRDRVGRRAHRA